MSTFAFHLAEINIARAIAPLDDPALATFVAQLDEVNVIADSSEGFVWRLKGEGGAASSYISAFQDPRLLINISVWTSMESLKQYVYRTHEHGNVFRDRRQWFEKMETPSLAMWWIPAGTIPTVEDALERIAMITERGPTPDAFTFKSPFPPPESKTHAQFPQKIEPERANR